MFTRGKIEKIILKITSKTEEFLNHSSCFKKMMLNKIYIFVRKITIQIFLANDHTHIFISTSILLNFSYHFLFLTILDTSKYAFSTKVRKRRAANLKLNHGTRPAQLIRFPGNKVSRLPGRPFAPSNSANSVFPFPLKGLWKSFFFAGENRISRDYVVTEVT